MTLPRAFYARDALLVAEDLVGCEIIHDDVRVRITEVEAYRNPFGAPVDGPAGDTANHARNGRTKRNAPMWGPAGNAYIYLCYGLHHMLNVVTGEDGVPEAVLIRGCEVVAGAEIVRARRGRDDGRAILGPGKVGQALGLTTAMSGCALGSALRIEAGQSTTTLLRRPRVGIPYASPEHQAAPWRLSAGVSKVTSSVFIHIKSDVVGFERSG